MTVENGDQAGKNEKFLTLTVWWPWRWIGSHRHTWHTSS